MIVSGSNTKQKSPNYQKFKKDIFSDMKQIKLFENGTAILKISELAIGNLMVLLAGLLGYLTGSLRGILGESKGQFQGGDEDNAYHSHGEFRRNILGPLDSRPVFFKFTKYSVIFLFQTSDSAI